MSEKQVVQDMGSAVSELLRPPKPPERLKAERVQLWLESRPEWRLNSNGRAVSRKLDFPGPQVATAYAAFVSSFAAAVNVPVTVGVHGGRVITRVHAPAPLGCHDDSTDLVLGFAGMLG